MDGSEGKWRYHHKPGLYVLIHGNVMWSSGHTLPGMAVVYEIDAAGVRVAGQTASVIEVYVVEPAGLRRIVYQRYSSPEVK